MLRCIDIHFDLVFSCSWIKRDISETQIYYWFFFLSFSVVYFDVGDFIWTICRPFRLVHSENWWIALCLTSTEAFLPLSKCNLPFFGLRVLYVLFSYHCSAFCICLLCSDAITHRYAHEHTRTFIQRTLALFYSEFFFLPLRFGQFQFDYMQ